MDEDAGDMGEGSKYRENLRVRVPRPFLQPRFGFVARFCCPLARDGRVFFFFHLATWLSAGTLCVGRSLDQMGSLRELFVLSDRFST